MNRSGSIISLENTLTAHRLSSTLCSVLVFGISQGFDLLILSALFTENHRCDWLHTEKRINWPVLVLVTLTCRPYLAFICFSSFCLKASLSSLLRAGPLGDTALSNIFHSKITLSEISEDFLKNSLKINNTAGFSKLL